MSYDEKANRFRCDFCTRFISRPFDSRTTFGCADPENPEPYDPDDYCRKCAKENYIKLLAGYKCCKRHGDWMKSDAEIRAAKEAGLVWIGNSPSYVETWSGRSIMNEYVRENFKLWGYMSYLEYMAKMRDEKRCRCWRVKDEDGNCPVCKRGELFCLCRYDSGTF